MVSLEFRNSSSNFYYPFISISVCWTHKNSDFKIKNGPRQKIPLSTAQNDSVLEELKLDSVLG